MHISGPSYVERRSASKLFLRLINSWTVKMLEYVFMCGAVLTVSSGL